MPLTPEQEAQAAAARLLGAAIDPSTARGQALLAAYKTDQDRIWNNAVAAYLAWYRAGVRKQWLVSWQVNGYAVPPTGQENPPAAWFSDTRYSDGRTLDDINGTGVNLNGPAFAMRAEGFVDFESLGETRITRLPRSSMREIQVLGRYLNAEERTAVRALTGSDALTHDPSVTDADVNAYQATLAQGGAFLGNQAPPSSNISPMTDPDPTRTIPGESVQPSTSDVAWRTPNDPPVPGADTAQTGSSSPVGGGATQNPLAAPVVGAGGMWQGTMPILIASDAPGPTNFSPSPQPRESSGTPMAPQLPFTTGLPPVPPGTPNTPSSTTSLLIAVGAFLLFGIIFP